MDCPDEDGIRNHSDGTRTETTYIGAGSETVQTGLGPDNAQIGVEHWTFRMGLGPQTSQMGAKFKIV